MMKSNLVKSLRKAFSQKILDHKTLVGLYEFEPNVYAEAIVHPTATIVGEVFIGPYVNVNANCVIRGDMNEVVINESSMLMENVSIGTVPSILNSGEVAKVFLARKVILDNNVRLMSCYIGEDCFIGANSVICEGAKVDDGSIIGPYSVVPPNRYIPKGQVWSGNPARYIKDVEKPERVGLIEKMKELQENSKEYIKEISDYSNAYMLSEELIDQGKATSIYCPQEFEVKIVNKKYED